MAKTFHATIAKVGENLFNGEVISLTLPGASGVLTVLANHAPLVCELKAGQIEIKATDGTAQSVLVERGVLEVSSNQATVLL
ncbi:MAG: F0F1 ATP synthase subunit epsilon [Minisyncoccia bacterium]